MSPSPLRSSLRAPAPCRAPPFFPLPRSDTSPPLSSIFAPLCRYSYTFQSYAFITRFIQHNEGVINNPNKVRILERSVFTDRKVFVSSLKDNSFLDDMEVSQPPSLSRI